MPERLGRLLTLVRWLISFGKEFAASLHQRATAPDFASTARVRFGTADFARILARITSGLRLAAALEARLLRHAAAGEDVPTASDRAASPRKPGSARSTANAAGHDKRAKDPASTGLDASLPTAEDIAAMVRRRPVGAVIADICRDLGIVPGVLTKAQWDELATTIIAYGGSLAHFIHDLLGRIHECVARTGEEPPNLLAVQTPHRAATGPP